MSWLKAQNSCRHWDETGAWFCGCAGARKIRVGGSVWRRNFGGAAAARRVRGRGGAAPMTKSNIHAAFFSMRSYGNLPEEGYLATMRGGTCSMSGPLRSRQRLTERGRPLARGAASPSGTASHGPAIWSRPQVSAVVAPVALRDVWPPPPWRVRPSVRPGVLSRRLAPFRSVRSWRLRRFPAVLGKGPKFVVLPPEAWSLCSGPGPPPSEWTPVEGGQAKEEKKSSLRRRAPSGARALPRPHGTGALPVVTWLILPVVICLSQRLSHACLSINDSVP